MNIGIRLHDTAAGTLRERAAAAHAQGFVCAQVALGKLLVSPPLPKDYSPAYAQALSTELCPLHVAVLGCYLNLAHPDEAAYRSALAQYTASLKLASWLGGCVVGTETGNPNADYRYDPLVSHTDEALQLFIGRLRPVVEAAENLGAVIAIEPMYAHIVHDAQSARAVLDAFASPSLKIILDPVNLLHPSNLERRKEVIASALELLGPDIAAIHLKDYVAEKGVLRAVASGLGETDDRPVLAYAVRHLPDVPLLMENTLPQNAARARNHVAQMLQDVMAELPATFATPRLQIRRFRETDLDAFAAYRNDAQWMRYQGFKGLDKAVYRKALLGPHMLADGLQLAIVRREDGELLGDLYLKQEGEILWLGYTVAPEYARRGYAAEAARGALAWAWQNGYRAVRAGVEPENVPSKGLLQKLGFRFIAREADEDVYETGPEGR